MEGSRRDREDQARSVGRRWRVAEILCFANASPFKRSFWLERGVVYRGFREAKSGKVSASFTPQLGKVRENARKI